MRLINADQLKIDMDCNIDFGSLDNRLMILGQIDKALTVEERKIGKWIYNKDTQNWECSECGEPPKTLGYVGTSAFMTEHFKFCNHCGTEMRGCENG